MNTNLAGILLLALAVVGCDRSTESTSSDSDVQVAEDQDDAREVPSSPAKKESSSQPLVWVERHATEKYAANRFKGPGFVIKKDKENAYVVGWPRITQGPDPAPYSCFITMGDAPDEKEIAARPIAYYGLQSCYLFEVAADQVPDPLPLDQAVVPTESMPVKVVGFKRGSQLLEVEGVVSKLHRDDAGEIHLIQIEAEEHLRHALVTDATGKKIVGVDFELINLGDDRNPQLISAARPPGYFADIDEPHIDTIRFSLDSSEGNRVILNARVRVTDPWQQLRNPELLLVAKVGRDRHVAPERDGDERGPLAEDALILPLQRLAPAPQPLLASIGGQDRLRCNPEYTAKLRASPRDNNLKGFIYPQLSFERPDGTRQYQPLGSAWAWHRSAGLESVD